MLDPIPARPRAVPRLTLPALDRDAAIRAFRERAPADYPGRRAQLEDWLARGERVLSRHFFEALDDAESEARFFALDDVGARLFAPDEVTLRYVIARFGARVLPFLEAWAAPGAPELLGSMGSLAGAATVLRRMADPDPAAAEEARAWADEHVASALEAAIQLASDRGDEGLAARAWLAEQPEAVTDRLVQSALDAGTERLAHGAPGVTARWFARRFGAAALEAACPASDRARLDAILDPTRDARWLDFEVRPAKWWPGALAASERAVLEAGCTPEHPDAIALRARLGPDADRAAAALLDAFEEDKAKPMHRFALAAALTLSPDAGPAKLSRLAWSWSRSKNRNHRTLVAYVAAYLGQAATPAAIARLGLLAAGLADEAHRAHAARALRAIALDRGTSIEDVLASAPPDLGLDERLAVSLDYGPRRFVVRFGSDGRPHVVDAKGKALASLPKPGKKDDPALAEAAHARFVEARDDVRHFLAAQAKRLERRMREQTSWTPDALAREISVPLMRLPLTGLVHAHEGGTLRVSDEGRMVDAEDELVAPADPVRIAHALALSDSERLRWGEVLADYELVPPFAQLDRPIHRAVVEGGLVNACRGWAIPAGALVGLLARGWRGRWTYGGVLEGASIAIPGGQARLAWPGFPAREARGAGAIELGPLAIAAPGIDPIALSEILLDLDRVRAR